jgi:periplasmic protein TonB
METGKRHTPTLDDIAFEGRNREYGAYYLRSRYTRYLFFSGAAATFVLLILVFLPLILELLEPEPNYDNLMPVYEFYALSPPSDDESDALPELPPPPPEPEVAPKVVDSVPPEKEKVKEEPKPEQESQVPDTSSGKGGNGTKDGTGPGEDTGLYLNIDVYPKYPGGDAACSAFIRKNLHYPEAAEKAKIEGIVMVVFVIEANGSVSHAEVSKGIGGGCDEEAVRVINSMHWEPGKRSGKPVRVIVRMPIVFRIPAKR